MEIDLKSMRIALRLVGINASEYTIELLATMHKEVQTKGDKLTLADISKIEELVKATHKPQE